MWLWRRGGSREAPGGGRTSLRRSVGRGWGLKRPEMARGVGGGAGLSRALGGEVRVSRGAGGWVGGLGSTISHAGPLVF